LRLRLVNIFREQSDAPSAQIYNLAKLGASKDTKISVKLRNKTKLKGYISAIEEDAFVIADSKTGAETRVAYGDVTQAKGNNLSTGAIIAISAGIAVGATLLVLYILARAYSD